MHGRILSFAMILSLFAAQASGAQSRTSTRLVREADSTGTTPRIRGRVTIAGRVTVGLGVLATSQLNVYVQDSSGSVFVDADTPEPFLRLTEGDSVVVTGRIDRDLSGNYLEDATVVLVPVARREPAPELLDALVPARLSALMSRLVTVEGTVAARDVGDGDDILTIGHSDAEGNYVTVVQDVDGNTKLGLDRFSLGDRLRVTGVLVRRTSRRTGISRYALYPRSAADVASLGLTARTRSSLIWFSMAGIALLALGSWRLRWARLRRREHLHAAQELREHAAQYRLLVEQAPIGIVVHRGGKIVFANTAFAALVASARTHELHACGLEEFFDPDTLARISDGTPRHESQARPQRILSQLRRMDGEIVDVEITDGPIAYEGGACVQAVVYDVTERTRAQQALAESETQMRQAQKMEAVGQLAGGVAHDFNNILTAIKGNAEFLLEGCARCGHVPPESTEINQAADRAAALTHQLLAFSRKQVIQPRVIEVDVLVRNLEPMLRRLVPENVLQRFILETSAQCVNADPGQLEQVIVNLVVNARDAMPRGGVLEIRTARMVIDAVDLRMDGATTKPGEYVTITVRDTGVGMDAVTRRRAFEPFFTTKEQGKGTGLGLSTVYGIVKQSDGYVDLDSVPGAGTTFTLYLPRVVALVDRKPASTASAVVPRGVETILVVEDEPAIRRMAARALEGHGYTVLLANDGVDALSIVRSHAARIDLLLTDVVMPGLGGSDIAAHLRSERDGLRVLFMSGYTDELIMRHGVLVAGVELLEKPFTPKQLLERVRRVLDTGKAEAA